MSSNIREMRREVQELKEELKGLQREARTSISLISTALTLTRRLTGDEKIDDAIGDIRRAIVVLNQFHTTIIMLQSSVGPLGWALTGMSILSTIFGVADLAVDLG